VVFAIACLPCLQFCPTKQTTPFAGGGYRARERWPRSSFRAERYLGREASLRPPTPSGGPLPSALAPRPFPRPSLSVSRGPSMASQPPSFGAGGWRWPPCVTPMTEPWPGCSVPDPARGDESPWRGLGGGIGMHSEVPTAPAWDRRLTTRLGVPVNQRHGSDEVCFPFDPPTSTLHLPPPRPSCQALRRIAHGVPLFHSGLGITTCALAALLVAPPLSAWQPPFTHFDVCKFFSET
jgi:hypothetical protein